MAKFVYITDADVYVNPDQVISIGKHENLTEIIMTNGMRYRTRTPMNSVRALLDEVWYGPKPRIQYISYDERGTKMSRLNVHVFDHAPFMTEVSHLLEDILGRPVSEYEDWRKLVNDSREVLKVMREPVATPNDAA